MDIFVHGFVSGTVQSVIGHPLDTMKTRLQAGKYPIIKSLYKGFVPSLFCGCFQNGFLFFWEYKSRSLIKSENKLVSGFASGVLTSIIICPLERWKVQAQTNVSNPPNLPWYRGLSWTIGRESCGTACYFYVYDQMRSYLNPFWSGGVAGIASWWLTYPMDVKKTQIQLQTKSSGNWLYGIFIVSVRAFLVNGSLFHVYESIT